jgi:hypothetical protein
MPCFPLAHPARPAVIASSGKGSVSNLAALVPAPKPEAIDPSSIAMVLAPLLGSQLSEKPKDVGDHEPDGHCS